MIGKGVEDGRMDVSKSQGLDFMTHLYYGEDIEMVEAVVRGLTLRARGADIALDAKFVEGGCQKKLAASDGKEVVLWGRHFDEATIAQADLVSRVVKIPRG